MGLQACNGSVVCPTDMCGVCGVLCVAIGHEIARSSYRKYAYLFDSLHRRYFWFRLIAFVVNFTVALQAVIVTDTITRVFATAVCIRLCVVCTATTAGSWV
jgi:hypothetical protein